MMMLWRVDRRIPILFFTLLTIALLGTLLSILVVIAPHDSSLGPFFPFGPTTSTPEKTLQGPFVTSVVRDISIPLSVTSWVALAGVFFIWRGKTRSMWLKLGFDQDVFKLFMKMRGAPTRLRLLQSLSTAKDRAQLAHDLGLDWKAVDRHVELLEKYGFVKEKSLEGTTKYYELTAIGTTLLRLVDEQDADQSS
jgi:DNA-binding transcriptional ArsR family regulator